MHSIDMARPVLPQEVVEIIIDEVGADKHRTRRINALRACALTSWSFLSPARKHIFSIVDLVEDKNENTQKCEQARARLEGFINLLQNDPCKAFPGYPTLSQHVKTLRIQLCRRIDAHFSNNIQDPETRRHFVAEIIHSLTKVEDLSLYFSGPHMRHFCAWDQAHQETKNAIEVFCTSRPSLSLRLISMLCFPVAIITRSRLTTLSLDFCTQLDWTTPLQSTTRATSSYHSSTIPKSPIPLMLDCLLLNDSGGLLRLLTANENPPKPHKLNTVYRNASKAQVVDIIKQLTSLRAVTVNDVYSDIEWAAFQALPSLTYLCIRFDQSDRPANKPVPARREWFDYGHLARLETLELFCDFGQKGIEAGFISLQKWRFFNPNLNGSMSQSSIHTLIIHGTWSKLTRKREGRNFWPRSGWKNLDTVLSDSSRFPNLSSLQLNLCLIYDDVWKISAEMLSTIRKELEKHVQDKLKRLLPVISRSHSVQVGINIDVLRKRHESHFKVY